MGLEIDDPALTGPDVAQVKAKNLFKNKKTDQ